MSCMWEPCVSCGRLVRHPLVDRSGRCPSCRSAELMEQAYEARERAERAVEHALELRAAADALVASPPRPDITRQER
jgi:DNA-directed RNA polymerase subunit RPC12/RpoP